MINFDHVSKSFGEEEVVKDISFTIESGELFVLIGLSGCGKTTTLRMMNRLEDLSSGRILVDGKDIREEDVIELRRNMGYVIQQIGLFPHRTVEDNITIIPELEGMKAGERKDVARKWMEMVGLPYESYKDRFPSELSGGQSQRVGVARALATDPDIVLMDEPFSALDPITRTDLQDQLKELHEKTGKTIVFVTHDMDEAIKIGDRICIMDEGKILQLDSPEEILKNPVNDFVREFVGEQRLWSNPEYIKVSDIMIEHPLSAGENYTVPEGAEMMTDYEFEALMLRDGEGKFAGAVMLKDLSREKNRKKTLRELGKMPEYIFREDDSLPEVMEAFHREDLMYAPVLDEKGMLTGLITRKKLVHELSDRYKEEN